MNRERIPFEYRQPLVREAEYDFITVDPVADGADNLIHVSWHSQGPTRITRFEVNHFDESSIEKARVTSLKVGNEEQLVGGPVPPALLARGLFIIPTIEPGIVLTLTLTDFCGRIKPVGEESLAAEEVEALPACQTCGEPRFITGPCVMCEASTLRKVLADQERERRPAYFLAYAICFAYWAGLFLAKWTPIAPCFATAIMAYLTLRGWRAIFQAPMAMVGDLIKSQAVRLVAPLAAIWDYRIGMVVLAVDMFCSAVTLTYFWKPKPHGPLSPND